MMDQIYGGARPPMDTLETVNASRALAGLPPVELAEYRHYVVGPPGLTFDDDAAEWNALTDYVARDAVTDAGSLWRARRDTVGERPSESPGAWLIVLEGVDTAFGEQTKAEVEAIGAEKVAQAEAARQASEAAQGEAQAAQAAAETARDLAAASATQAQAAALTCATWAALFALTGSYAGQGAEVLDTDAGTHTDPVAGGTVSNGGRYSWSVSPAGWRRIGDTGLTGKANITVGQEVVAPAGVLVTVPVADPQDGDIFPIAEDEDGRVPIGVYRQTGAVMLRDVTPVTARAIRRRMFGSESDLSMDAAPAGEPQDGDFGTPWLEDEAGRVIASLLRDGRLRFPRGVDGATARAIAAQIGAGGGGGAGLTEGAPGWNHRLSARSGHIIATMPTPFGPVDVDLPLSGGLALAMTTSPIALMSFSGQSNTLSGTADEDVTGDVTTIGDSDFGLHVRGLRDPHRALRGPVQRYAVSAPGGLAPYYTAGSINALLPAGQDAEIYGIYTWLPDLIQFSAILIDQMLQQPQTVYVQMTSAQGSTPITDYLPGQIKGNNIAGATGTGGYVAGTQSYLQGLGHDVIAPAHFLVGHEDATHPGYATYADALTALVDYICPALEALAGNVAADQAARVITYQANCARGEADGTSYPSGGTLDSHTLSLTDARIINIGGVYDERVADGGIHMRGKFMTAFKMAWACAQWYRRGQRIQPPYVSAAVWDGDTTISCEVSSSFPGPLREDTDWLPVIADGGLRYGDSTGGAAPVITAVQIENTLSTESVMTRRLILTLSGVPTGSDKTLYIGGRNNADQADWSGGLTAFYIPGVPNPWYRDYPDFNTPDIRWRLCPAIVPVEE